MVSDHLPVNSFFIKIQSRAWTGLRGTNSGSNGEPIAPLAMAAEIADRMIGLFRKDEHEHRACFGPYRKFQEDPHWRDCLLFNEYYNADTGQGLGASHQTGWTGLVANLIDEWRR